MGLFNAKGYMTLADLDALEDRIVKLEETLKGGDLVAYSSDSKYNTAAGMLAFEKSGFVARRISMSFSKSTLIEGIKFGQDFVEPPIVVCNAVSDKNPYIAFPENVTNTSCSIRIIPINTMQNKKSAKNIDAKGKGDYVDLIAVGKTKD